MTMYSTIYGNVRTVALGGEGDPSIGHNLLPPTDWHIKLGRHHRYCGQFGHRSGSGQVAICRSSTKVSRRKSPNGHVGRYRGRYRWQRNRNCCFRGETPDTWIMGACQIRRNAVCRNVRPLIPALRFYTTQLAPVGCSS